MIKRLLIIASLVIVALIVIAKSEVLGALASGLLCIVCLWLAMVLVMGIFTCTTPSENQ